MDVVAFFENYGLPAVIIGVLFGILWYKIKKNDEQQAKLFDFICSVVKDQGAVIASNTNAFNNLSVTMGDFANTQAKMSSIMEKMLYYLTDAPKHKQQASGE